jgi:hypothetical protein
VVRASKLGAPENKIQDEMLPFMVFLWSGIFKLLRISGIDSKESITPAYVA